MRVRLKGINSITKTLADGTRRTYWYAWKGGPPLRGEPGTPEFIHSYNVAIARKVVPPRGTLLSVAAHALRHDARKPSDVHGLPSLLVSMIGERFSGRSRADRLSSESPMRSWRDPPLTGQQAITLQRPHAGRGGRRARCCPHRARRQRLRAPHAPRAERRNGLALRLVNRPPIRDVRRTELSRQV
jgi:hypothetical protein